MIESARLNLPEANCVFLYIYLYRLSIASIVVRLYIRESREIKQTEANLESSSNFPGGSSRVRLKIAIMRSNW